MNETQNIVLVIKTKRGHEIGAKFYLNILQLQKQFFSSPPWESNYTTKCQKGSICFISENNKKKQIKYYNDLKNYKSVHFVIKHIFH